MEVISCFREQGRNSEDMDIRSGRELRTLIGHKGDVNSIAFSPDGRTLGFRGVKITRSNSGMYQQGVERRHCSGIADKWGLTVTFSRDGLTLISGSKDRTVRFWDVRNRVAR